MLVDGKVVTHEHAPVTRRPWASRPSTRTSRSRPTWTPRRTCSWAASCAGSAVLHDQREMRRRTAARFKELGVGLVQDLRVPVASFSGGQRQSVAIARAAMWAQHVIIMDEPTAALGVIQTAKVLDLIKTVRDTRPGGRLHLAQPARGARGRRPDRGDAPRCARGALPARRGRRRQAHRLHLRRLCQRAGAGMTRTPKAALNAELAGRGGHRRHASTPEPQRSRWRELLASQVFITLGFLLALIVIFSVLAPGKFGTANNLSLLAQNVAILTVVSDRHHVRHRHRRHRPVDPERHHPGRGLRRERAQGASRRRRLRHRRRGATTPTVVIILAALAAALVAGPAHRRHQRVRSWRTCASRPCSPRWAPWARAWVSRCSCRRASTSRPTRSPRSPIATSCPASRTWC